MDRGMPTGIGLWAGFLDRLPIGQAIAAVTDLQRAGVRTIWLQEFSGVDPFVRAALYLQATEALSVALGVATIHARDPEAMVAAASVLHDAFPGRFHLGLGASHPHLANARGVRYPKPLTAMREYLAAMDSAAGSRVLPPRFLGALGPEMTALAGAATHGVHTYFCPVEHTATARAATGMQTWIAPTVMIATGLSGPGWHDGVRDYLKLCAGMPNYRRNLNRYDYRDDELDTICDRLVEALAVEDTPDAIDTRVAQHQDAGADHVVVQFIPPAASRAVLDRVMAGFPDGVRR